MSATETRPRHIKVWARDGGLTLEPCEDGDCFVDPSGRASCGRTACPSCSSSGVNIIGEQPLGLVCTCGHAWLPSAG